MVMDTFSPKVNLCPSWMCLMANTLGIPGGVVTDGNPHFIFGLDLRSSQKTKKKKEKIGKFGALKQMEATGFCCFGELLFSRWYIFIISSIAGFIASFFVDLRWGMPSSASVLLQCQTLVPLPSELLASWPAGGEDTRHVDGVRHPLQMKGVWGRTHAPKQKCEGEQLWQVNLFVYFFFKDGVFFCNVSKPPTHTHLQRLLFGSSTWWTCWNWPPTLLQSISGSQWIFPTWCICSRMMCDIGIC